jgi:hypothetical protein
MSDISEVSIRLVADDGNKTEPFGGSDLLTDIKYYLSEGYSLEQIQETLNMLLKQKDKNGGRIHRLIIEVRGSDEKVQNS